jgi:hypothetical protein
MARTHGYLLRISMADWLRLKEYCEEQGSTIRDFLIAAIRQRLAQPPVERLVITSRSILHVVDKLRLVAEPSDFGKAEHEALPEVVREFD